MPGRESGSNRWRTFEATLRRCDRNDPGGELGRLSRAGEPRAPAASRRRAGAGKAWQGPIGTGRRCDLGDAEGGRGTHGCGRALEVYVVSDVRYSFVSDDLEEAL